MKKIVIMIGLMFSLLGLSSWAVAEESSFWDQAKESAGHAAAWTKNKSKEGWEATEDERENALEWTGDKAEAGWQGAGKLIDKVMD